MQRRRCNVIFEEKWNLSAVQLPKAWECLSAVPSGGMPACCRKMLSLHGLKKWRFHLRTEKSTSTQVIRSFNILARKKLNLNDTLKLHFYSIRNWKGFLLSPSGSAGLGCTTSPLFTKVSAKWASKVLRIETITNNKQKRPIEKNEWTKVGYRGDCNVSWEVVKRL